MPSEWIKCRERLPEWQGMKCLVALGDTIEMAEYWFPEPGVHDAEEAEWIPSRGPFTDDTLGYTPSHWMPLPEPPKED